MPNSQIQLSYQVCPIILTGGVASQLPGSIMPMLSLFGVPQQGGSLAPGILPFQMDSLDDAFAAFNVLPGGTLVAQSIGKYPFANQWVAANAVIREPLTLSVIMDTPMRGPNAWALKHMVFTALKATLDQHNNAGGTYTVATPAYQYDNLVMLSLTDNSRGSNSLPQNAWRFDFEKPLISMAELGMAQNQQMANLTNGTPTDGNPTALRTGSTTPDVTQSEGTAFASSNISPMQTILSSSGMMIGGSGQIITPVFNPNYPPIAPGTGPGTVFNGIS